MQRIPFIFKARKDPPVDASTSLLIAIATRLQKMKEMAEMLFECIKTHCILFSLFQVGLIFATKSTKRLFQRGKFWKTHQKTHVEAKIERKKESAPLHKVGRQIKTRPYHCFSCFSIIFSPFTNALSLWSEGNNALFIYNKTL